MTNALLAEHGLKQAKIAAALILKAKQVLGHSDEDIHNYLEKALQGTKELMDWYASGDALKTFQQGDPDDEGEDYDTYAPEIYAMNSIDPDLLEFPPEYESGLKEAIQKRKAALLRAGGVPEQDIQNVANAIQGVM